jgi:hypothetical protein
VKYRFDSIFFLPCPLSLFSAVLQVHAGVREEGEKRSGGGVDGRRSGERGDANMLASSRRGERGKGKEEWWWGGWPLIL